MKRIVPFLIFALTVANSKNALAQSSCPTIVNSTFRIVNTASCVNHVTFDFINPTNGQKRINVKVEVGATTVIDDCYDAGGQAGVQRTYNSADFTACDLATVTVTLNTYTGSNCNGATPCATAKISRAGAPLPVVFKSFTVNRAAQNVTLKWVTATEINNKGFIVERNQNGTWVEAGFLETKAFGGNSSGDISYSFNENNFSKGMTQYRLRQVDIDGNFKYSDIRAIQGTEQDGKTTIFPNPSNNGKVNIVFDATATRDITIADMSGRIVKQYRNFNANSLQIDGLGAGMYTVRSNNLESGLVMLDKFVVVGR